MGCSGACGAKRAHYGQLWVVAGLEGLVIDSYGL